MENHAGGRHAAAERNIPRQRSVWKRVMIQRILERERGITIWQKTPPCFFHDTKITLWIPRPSDFGGRSERGLRWLTVCCCWWMPAKGRCRKRVMCYRRRWPPSCPPIIVLNKIDRVDARAQGGLRRNLRICLSIWTRRDQLDFPDLHNARDGVAYRKLGEDPRICCRCLKRS